MSELSYITEKHIESIGKLKRPTRLFGLSIFQQESFVSKVEHLNNYFLVYVRSDVEQVRNLEKQIINQLTQNAEHVIGSLDDEFYFVVCSYELKNEAILMIIQKNEKCNISNVLSECEGSFQHDEIMSFDPTKLDQEQSYLSERELPKLRNIVKNLLNT